VRMTGSGGRGPGVVLVVALLVIGLVVIPLALSGGGSPADWLDERYERVAGDDPDEETVVWEADGDFDQVVNAIVAGTDPDDQTAGSATPSNLVDPSDLDDPESLDGLDTATGSTAVFLRYDSDWIVTVIQGEDTQRIELDEFDRGYNRHGVFVGIWGGFYNRGGGLFRGGGSGFGK
jgi:hypothetical protein